MLNGIKIDNSSECGVRTNKNTSLSGIMGNDVTRKYYKGKSFRWAGYWKSGEHYFNDEYIVDFVSIEGAMCICEVSHFSNENNKPILKYDAKGNIVGLENTKYWQISLVGGGGSSNGAVRFDIDQNLDEETQKSRARINIGAVSQKDVNKIADAKINPLVAKITNLEERTEEIKEDISALNEKTTFDTELSETSEKAVQNKVITKEIRSLTAKIVPIEQSITDIDIKVTNLEQNLTWTDETGKPVI